MNEYAGHIEDALEEDAPRRAQEIAASEEAAAPGRGRRRAGHLPRRRECPGGPLPPLARPQRHRHLPAPQISGIRGRRR